MRVEEKAKTSVTSHFSTHSFSKFLISRTLVEFSRKSAEKIKFTMVNSTVVLFMKTLRLRRTLAVVYN